MPTTLCNFDHHVNQHIPVKIIILKHRIIRVADGKGKVVSLEMTKLLVVSSFSCLSPLHYFKTKCVKVSLQFFPRGCISEIVLYYKLEKIFCLSERKTASKFNILLEAQHVL